MKVYSHVNLFLFHCINGSYICVSHMQKRGGGNNRTLHVTMFWLSSLWSAHPICSETAYVTHVIKRSENVLCSVINNIKYSCLEIPQARIAHIVKWLPMGQNISVRLLVGEKLFLLPRPLQFHIYWVLDVTLSKHEDYNPMEERWNILITKDVANPNLLWGGGGGHSPRVVTTVISN
jgi:hypothetical protein